VLGRRRNENMKIPETVRREVQLADVEKEGGPRRKFAEGFIFFDPDALLVSECGRIHS
jgi:hypothetical protein